MVKAYRQSLVKGFNDEELEFAKAVCCLRQICAVKVGPGYVDGKWVCVCVCVCACIVAQCTYACVY